MWRLKRDLLKKVESDMNEADEELKMIDQSLSPIEYGYALGKRNYIKSTLIPWLTDKNKTIRKL